VFAFDVCFVMSMMCVHNLTYASLHCQTLRGLRMYASCLLMYMLLTCLFLVSLHVETGHIMFLGDDRFVMVYEDIL